MTMIFVKNRIEKGITLDTLSTLFSDGCMCGGEHSYAAGIQLEDEAFFRVDSNTIAGELSAMI